MPRLFVGIPVPGECREALAGAVRALAAAAGDGLRPTRPENFHLTLQFLGETPDDRVAAVADALAPVAFAPFTLRPGRIGCLPDCRRPRVIHTDAAQGGEACAVLAGLVRDAMDPLGYPRGNSFTPHLTLARIKRPGGVDWRALVARRPADLPAFWVDRFVLWRSELKPSGPVYTALREFPAGLPEPPAA